MGYDYPECIVCYGTNRMNEDSSYIYRFCKECLYSMTNVGGIRMRAYLEDVECIIVCDKCKKEEEGYKYIPLCESHIKQYIDK